MTQRRKNQCDLTFGDEFLDTILTAQYMKEIICKLDFIQSKSVCCLKDSVLLRG